jgi:hypothetical protein
MRRRSLLILPLFLAPACRRSTPPAAETRIDPKLAALVPADAVLLAGIRMAELRGTPVHRWLAARLPALAEARRLLAFFSGGKLGVAIQSQSGVTVFPNASSGPAPADLLARGETLDGEGPVWAVARGGISFPLHGNAANLNRFLRQVEYCTVAADLRSGLHASLRGQCRTEAQAQSLEQTVRAFLTLARAAGRERVETALEREPGNVVAVRLTASEEQAEAMLGALFRER